MAGGGPTLSGTNCDVHMRERQPSFMRSCCGEARCFKNVLDLEDHILDLDPDQLFHFVHKNTDDIVVTSTPKPSNGLNSCMMYGDYRSNEDFGNGYVTDISVKSYDKNKVLVCWHILDIYRGHYITHNLTRNMVDIKKLFLK